MSAALTGKIFVSKEVDPTEVARPLKVGVSNTWDDEFGIYMDGVTKVYPKNLDNNSGDPTGMAVTQYTAVGGNRVTSTDTFLNVVPANFTIKVESPVERVIFEGRKAVGVEVLGKKSTRHDVGNVIFRKS